MEVEIKGGDGNRGGDGDIAETEMEMREFSCLPAQENSSTKTVRAVLL